MHSTRLIVALVLVPLLIAYIVLLPPVYFLGMILAVSVLAQAEFYAMSRIDLKYRGLGILAGIAIMVLVYRNGGLSEEFFAAGFLILAAFRLFARSTAVNSFKDVSYTALGVLYIPLLLSFQIKLREFGPQWIIYVDSCVWAADSAAYYVGKGFGKKKLYEAISPKKTIAGAYGSIGGAVLIALLFNFLFVKTLTAAQALLIGIVIGFVSIIGDLAESMFKRDSGVKDSSHIIPGHGGLLDKIDGITFVTPVVYWIITRVFLL